MSDDPGITIRDAIRAVLAAAPWGRSGQTVLALGWATVDAARAATEVAGRWPRSAPFEPAAREQLLGADCLMGRTVEDDGMHVRLVLLEPVTEGRLAATLARHGEGPAVLWLAAGRADGQGRAGGSEPAVSGRVDGPFGPERLVLGGPVGGPHLLLVERPASTIER